jgi:hypothetical protein
VPHIVEPAQGAGSVTIVLAEFCLPRRPATRRCRDGERGHGAIELSSFLLRIDTLVLPLPRLASPVAPGRASSFDSTGAESSRHRQHASSGFGLRVDGGSVSLLSNDERVLDRIAWGDAADAIMPPLGSIPPDHVDPGSSFGRPPGANQPGATTDWVIYPADQVTPGRPNPLPAVIQLLPLHGAILQATTARLSWYPVPGAARYRVQLARDTAFAPAILDQTVDVPNVSSGQLAAGVYWWRVQAMSADGPPAAWSRPSRIEFESRPPGGDNGAQDGGDEAPADASAASGDPAAGRLRCPPGAADLSAQGWPHAAARVAAIRRPRTAGRLPPLPHAWDRDHGDLDRKIRPTT